MEYSPMQNVQKGKKYPACWLTGGLHDPRVAYWEPAKVSDSFILNMTKCCVSAMFYFTNRLELLSSIPQFTATLRHANPDNEHPICMKLDLSAGHFSASDRYKYYKELAYDYSFLLDQLDLA